MKKILLVIITCILFFLKSDAQNVPLCKTLGYADLGIAPIYNTHNFLSTILHYLSCEQI